MTRPRLRLGILSDVGRMRDRNEDSHAVFLRHEGEEVASRGDALFLVADGMGGHEAGDVASRLAADSIRAWFTDAGVREHASESGFTTELYDRVLETNRSLLELGRNEGLAAGVGSTLTLACVRGDRLHVAHVGDTRLYRLRGDAFEQLTPDHSWVAEQERAGLLSPDQIRNHPHRHMLTECLGMTNAVEVFSATHDVRAGDRYLLCSDGLHGSVADPELAHLLADSRDPQATVRTLVDLANERSGPDNVTAIVVHVEADPLAETQPITIRTVTSGLRRVVLALGVLMLVTAVLLGERALRIGDAEPSLTPSRTVPEGESSPTPEGRPQGEIQP